MQVLSGPQLSDYQVFPPSTFAELWPCNLPTTKLTREHLCIHLKLDSSPQKGHIYIWGIITSIQNPNYKQCQTGRVPNRNLKGIQLRIWRIVFIFCQNYSLCLWNSSLLRLMIKSPFMIRLTLNWVVHGGAQEEAYPWHDRSVESSQGGAWEFDDSDYNECAFWPAGPLLWLLSSWKWWQQLWYN